MKQLKVFRRCLCLVCGSWLMLGQMRVSQAQMTLNVTNFGAVGDLLTLANISTVSNSMAIVCPTANFVASDTNKLIEIFGGGIFQNPSNETLFAFITGISSSSNITLSVAPGATSSNLTGCYGTDDQPYFSNAIAACSIPTDTIIIPKGNYLIVPRELIYGYGGNYSLYSIALHRGGITFAGQGNAIITGCGGWRAFAGEGHTCQRSATFGLVAPIANDYPLVFSNLTLDGGVTVGNIHNLSWPTSGSTGLGWDGTHHWMVTKGGSAPFLSSLVMVNCAVQHWRGEMMEATEGSPNLYLTADNCLFADGDGSCINNFAHNCSACTFSNANQSEEFYRSYATNQSFMVNCLFTDLSTGTALNGGLYTIAGRPEPPYSLIGNIFTNCGWVMYTTPAINVNFISNICWTAQGLGLGSAGYQGGTINSNIVAAYNTFNGAQYPLQILGNGNNSVANVYFFSNQINNAWGIGTGYGWSTNVYVFNNTGSNVGPFNEAALTGQNFIDVSNQYKPNGQGGNGISGATTNIFSYANGSQGQILSYNSTNCFLALDNTHPGKIPLGAVMIITNSASPTYSKANGWSSFTGSCSYSIYTNPKCVGIPVEIGLGQVVTFYWDGIDNWIPKQTLLPPTNLQVK